MNLRRNINMRLDQYLVKSGLVSGRDRASSEIKEGLVLVNSKQVKKASYIVEDTDDVVYLGDAQKYVSRGGLKLEKAFKEFKLNAHDKVCLDVGASTPGFTDVLLQNGAKHVVSLDVGHGQLSKKLLSDDRVTNIEGFNFKDIDEADEKEKAQLLSMNFDIIVSDVSFISLKKLLSSFKRVSKETELILLIKPQFEAGRGKLNKKGVVSDLSIHEEIISSVITEFLNSGFIFRNLSKSPIKGPEGNTEYLLHLYFGLEDMRNIDNKELKDIVHNTVFFEQN